MINTFGMTKQLIKDKIDQLPDTKIDTVADYIDYILYRENYPISTDDIINLQLKSGVFDFLKEEPDLYSDDKLVEIY